MSLEAIPYERCKFLMNYVTEKKSVKKPIVSQTETFFMSELEIYIKPIFLWGVKNSVSK